jgi:hypothetical protein
VSVPFGHLPLHTVLWQCMPVGCSQLEAYAFGAISQLGEMTCCALHTRGTAIMQLQAICMARRGPSAEEC